MAVAARKREAVDVHNRWATFAVVSVAQFMVILDASIMNVALPSIQRGLHFSQVDLQWVINIYVLMFGGFLLLGGRAGECRGTVRGTPQVRPPPVEGPRRACHPPGAGGVCTRRRPEPLDRP